MTTPTIKCPDWCTAHRAPGHPEDEAHSAALSAGFIDLELNRFIIDPAPYVYSHAMNDEQPITVEQLRELSRAALAAAEWLEAQKVDA